MTTFSVYITLGNAEMRTGRNVAGALREIADKVEGGHTEGRIMDANGNSVGTWTRSGPGEWPAEDDQ